MDEHYLDYTEEHERFARHIGPGDNKHIFFSGRYGVGKSTFIRKFFEKHKDEYYSVFLTPVDYVVSSNENIFELIKADIIRHLFQDEILEQYQKTLIEKTTAIIKATGHKAHKIAPVLIGLLNKLHPVSPFSLIDSVALGKLVDLAIEIDQDVKVSLKDVADKLDEYGLALTEKEGTHLEFNTISELIKETIHSIKKETVLIIDDLDRLDPDHIFRLLNIFSAHHNKQSDTNKFGFDKVILIGDYDNIEKIYHHRYGADADFRGYFDKYFSREVFEFDFNSILLKFVDEKTGNEMPDYAKSFLAWIINLLIREKQVRFRDVSKVILATPYSKNRIILFDNLDENKKRISMLSSSVPLFRILELLIIFFGGYKKISNYLSEITKNRNNSPFGKAIEIDTAKQFINTIAISSLLLTQKERIPIKGKFNISVPNFIPASPIISCEVEYSLNSIQTENNHKINKVNIQIQSIHLINKNSHTPNFVEGNIILMLKEVLKNNKKHLADLGLS